MDTRERAHQIAVSIPAKKKAAWVATVLGAAIEHLDVPTDVLSLTDPDLDFVEAAAIFHRLRALTLEVERGDRDPLRYALLLVAENAAKVVADPWGERFNADAAGWFWICIEHLLAIRSIDSMTAAVMPMLAEVATSPSG